LGNQFNLTEQFLLVHNDRTKLAHLAKRCAECVVGFATVAIGCGMLYALALVARIPKVDIWQAIGVSVGVFLYSCVVELLILGGVQLAVGETSRVTMLIRRSKLVLFCGMLVTSLLIAIVALLILIP
jgi:hypothetical protein